MDEAKDSRMKYYDMPIEFHGRANHIALTCKQHMRTCEALARRLATENPKSKNEFEKVEFYKDFVIKTAQLNDQVLGLVDYVQGLLNAMVADLTLMDEAKAKDTLKFQSDTIDALIDQRESLVKMLYELRSNQINNK